ncbi:putative lprM protein [Mycobacterium xenopi 4042]|uniref:Putative lprM protein n=1 Tax=Mycobacterium xenopi 4042 TaxID=1299334 RepID=X7ZTR4_MYCXE|nr:putative lprM protein [Mycobacterium xenopi 4042]
MGYLNDQKHDIIAATESLNNLVGQFADQKPVIDKALKTIPEALSVLKDERDNLAEALSELGKVGRLPPIRSTKLRRTWSRSSKTSGRCCNHWPMPGPANPFSWFPRNFPVPERHTS